MSTGTRTDVRRVRAVPPVLKLNSLNCSRVTVRRGGRVYGLGLQLEGGLEPFADDFVQLVGHVS